MSILPRKDNKLRPMPLGKKQRPAPKGRKTGPVTPPGGRGRRTF